MSTQEFTLRVAGADVRVRLEDLAGERRRVTTQKTIIVPCGFVDQRKAEQNRAAEANGGRAPIGDSHGAWQKVGEIPLGFLLSKIPMDALEDRKAILKLLSDPDHRHMRSDAAHRRL